jgi:hypothetical protein
MKRIKSSLESEILAIILLSSGLPSKHIKIKIHRNVKFPVATYGCENWSRTLSEERRLRVFENKVLRKIFGFKTD